jgi:hypothetical protein
MEELLRAIDQFLTRPQPEQAWERLASRRGLVFGRLRECVSTGAGAEVHRRLRECREAVRQERFAEQLSRLPGHEAAGDSVDAARLRRGLLRLLGTAQLALLLRHGTGSGFEEEQLACALPDALPGLDGTGPGRLEGTLTSGCWAERPGAARVNVLFGHLAELGFDVLTPRLWTSWWLEESSPGEPALSVPVAGFDPVRNAAWVAHLEVGRLRPAGQGCLVEHPAMALCRLGRSWLGEVDAGWRQVGSQAWWRLHAVPLTRSAVLGGTVSAAGRAAFQLLDQGARYDLKVLLLCRVDARGELHPADQEQALLSAARQGGYRPVVTASCDGCGSVGEADVVRVCNIDEAIRAASAPLEALRRYLERLIERPDRVRPAHLGGRLPSRLYPVPLVRRPEGSGTASGSRRSEPWTTRLDEVRRAVVVGPPGEGRAWLAEVTSRHLAQKALKQLDNSEGDCRSVVVPVYLHPGEVALSGSLPEALGNAMDGRPGELADLLRDALSSGRCQIILDGLDEVPPERVKHLLTALKPPGASPFLVLLTGSSEAAHSAWPAASALDVYEQLPLSDRQRREFVDRWFGQSGPKRESVLDWLRGNAWAGELSRDPAHLTLICAAGEEDRLGKVHRPAELFRVFMKIMLAGLSPDDRCHRKWQDWLYRLAWLQLASSASSLLFSTADVESSLDDKEADAEQVACFCEAFEGAGVFVRVSPGLYRWLSADLVSYLAAWHLEGSWNPADPPEKWLGPWQESLVPWLAGVLDEPRPLLDRLVRLYRESPADRERLVLLAGRALGHVNPDGFDASVAEKITGGVLDLWEKDPERAWISLAHRWGIERLKKYLPGVGGRSSHPPPPDPNAADLRPRVVRALGKLGSEGVVDGLLDPDPMVRREAALALPDLGERGVESLRSLLEECDGARRQDAISTLTEVRYGFLIDRLIRLTKEEKPEETRKHAVSVLANLTPRETETLSLTIPEVGSDGGAAGDRTGGHFSVKEAVVQGLLWPVFHDRAPGVRSIAIDRLTGICFDDLIRILEEGLEHVEESIARRAMEALLRINYTECRRAIVRCLTHENEIVRSRASIAFGLLTVRPFVRDVLAAPILDALDKATDRDVRCCHILTLGLLGERGELYLRRWRTGVYNQPHWPHGNVQHS